MNKLKVGMKVRAISEAEHKEFPRWFPKPGTIGTVTDVGNDDVCVEWEDKKCYIPTGYWCMAESVVPVRGDRIVIFVDGKNSNMVVAKDTVTGKTATAKCNPEDKFVFATGAKLALERLCAEEKKRGKCKFKNGDIIVGNSKANKYGFTKEGWIGVVAKVYDEPLEGEGCDRNVDIWFRAKSANDKGFLTFALDQNAFDLV